MTNLNEEHNQPTREHLTKKADRVRARMMERVDELDERRQQVDRILNSISTGVRRHLPLVVGVTAASVALLFVIKRAKRHQDHPWQLRVRQPDSGGFVMRLLKEAGVALAVQIARRAGERALNSAQLEAGAPVHGLAPNVAE